MCCVSPPSTSPSSEEEDEAEAEEDSVSSEDELSWPPSPSLAMGLTSRLKLVAGSSLDCDSSSFFFRRRDRCFFSSAAASAAAFAAAAAIAASSIKSAVRSVDCDRSLKPNETAASMAHSINSVPYSGRCSRCSCL